MTSKNAESGSAKLVVVSATPVSDVWIDQYDKQHRRYHQLPITITVERRTDRICNALVRISTGGAKKGRASGSLGVAQATFVANGIVHADLYNGANERKPEKRGWWSLPSNQFGNQVDTRRAKYHINGLHSFQNTVRCYQIK